MNFVNLVLLYITAIGCFVFAQASFSSVKNRKVIQRELSSDTHTVQIRTQGADIQVLPVKGPAKKNKLKKPPEKTIKIQYQGEFKTKTEDHIFKIFEKTSKFKEQNRDQEKTSLTLYLADNMSLQILASAGNIRIKNIQAPVLFISSPGKTSIQTRNTKAKLSIFQETGGIQIDSHKGALNIQTENSKVDIKNSQGNMELRAFKGRLDIQQSKGKLYVRTFKAPIRLKHFTGQVASHQDKGGLYLQPMFGSIQARSDTAEIKGRLYPEKVNIETKTGVISLNMPDSRAWVTLESWEGRIKTPAYFYRSRTGGLSRAKGRLRGKKNKGEVQLKSLSGAIEVYQIK